MFGEPITDVLSGMYLLQDENDAREVQITSTSFDIEVEIAGVVASAGQDNPGPHKLRREARDAKAPLKRRRQDNDTLFWMAYYYNPLLLFGGLVSALRNSCRGHLGVDALREAGFDVWHGGYALLGVMLLSSLLKAPPSPWALS